MTRVVVLGGGVSGLTAAFLARQGLQGAKGSVTLVEGAKRSGGWFMSKRDESGFLLECGPHSFRPVGPSGNSVLRLIEELGLEKKAIGSSMVAKQRYVRVAGEMHELKTSVRGLLEDAVTRPLPMAAVREALRPGKGRGAPDESVHDFFERRFGSYVAETFADALVQGIFAGDTRQLSLAACFPLLEELERSSGSVVRGMLLKQLLPQMAGAGTRAPPPIALQTEEARALQQHTGVSFPDGLQVLVDTLEERTFGGDRFGNVECSLLRGSPVTRIEEREVELEDGTRLPADYVLSALPLPALRAALPAAHASELAGLESLTPFASVAVVNLAYEGMANLPLPGFGHLVPTNQREGVLGMIYDSEVFPQQQPAGTSALTVMIGGAKFPERAQGSPEEILAFATAKVEEHLGISQRPSASAVTKHQNCIPQYAVGHAAAAEAAKERLGRALPSLRMFGNHFGGVGIADSVNNARRAVQSINLPVHVSYK